MNHPSLKKHTIEVILNSLVAQNQYSTMGKENGDNRKSLEIKHVIDMCKNNMRLKAEDLHSNVD